MRFILFVQQYTNFLLFFHLHLLNEKKNTSNSAFHFYFDVLFRRLGCMHDARCAFFSKFVCLHRGFFIFFLFFALYIFITACSIRFFFGASKYTLHTLTLTLPTARQIPVLLHCLQFNIILVYSTPSIDGWMFRWLAVKFCIIRCCSFSILLTNGMHF